VNSDHWLDIDADIEAASRHFSRAHQLSQIGTFEGSSLERYRDEMALMHAMQSGYTASEAALVRIFTLIREKPPDGSDWHKVLIDRAARPIAGDLARPAIVSHDVAADLHTARTFRHRVTHSYDDFELSKAEPALDAARRLINSFPADIAAFRQVIDP
jgi:uncharacterized protein YutE (UPF0331/DUF86 family)